MSQKNRTARHKERHPENEAVRKERQRRREELVRFHIRRQVLGRIPIPSEIERDALFERVAAAYERQIREPVEVFER